MSPVIHNKRTERRSGIDRRQFSYALHIPERRNRLDRRRKSPKRLQETMPGKAASILGNSRPTV
jgi:hypothetical protein